MYIYICSFLRNNSGKYSPTIPPSLQETSAQPAWLLQPRFLPSSTLPVPQSPLAFHPTQDSKKYAPHLWKENARTIHLVVYFVNTGSTTVVAVLNSNHYGVEYQNNVCLEFVHSSTPVAYPSCTWLQPWLWFATPELDMSLTQLKSCII